MLRAAILLLLTFPAVSPVHAVESVNLVANGDFARDADGTPQGWAACGAPTNVHQILSIEEDDDGKRFARLACTRCEPKGGDSHAMLAQVGQVHLTQNHLYQFSCRLRATGLASRTVRVAIQETDGWLPSGLFTEFNLRPNWQPYHVIFRATRDVGPSGRLQLWFAEPGTLDVADVRIAELAAQTFEYTNVIAASGARNLLPNGSFELGGAGWSSLGTGVGWGDLDRLHGSVQMGGTHGKSFLRIPLGGDQTPVLHFDYFVPTVKRELRVMAANVGWIPVEKGAVYTVSCDMRSSVSGVRAAIGIRAQDPADGRFEDDSRSVMLETAWRRYSHTFHPAHNWVFAFAGPDLAEEQRVDVDIDGIQLENNEQGTPFQPRTELEFAVEPSQPAGIFVEDESNSVTLRLCNHATTSMTVAVDFDVTDYADKPIALPPVAVDVPPQTSVKRVIPLPSDWKGFYHVRAKASTRGTTETSALRLVIVPPPTIRNSVCGVNHAFVSAEQIQLARKAGVTWYRDWSLKWQHVEPLRGEYRWERSDAQIDRVLLEGVNVLPLLPPFPSAGWNSRAPATLPDSGSERASQLRSSFAPKDPAELGRFVGKAVQRYKQRVHLWEFLNEPIYTSYALWADPTGQLGGEHYTPADYVALLSVASEGMREADPSCKILGGIAGTPTTMTREVIEAGCLKYVDIFNLHIYPGKRAPETYATEMKNLLAMMDAHGGRKPIWITEFSYYGADNLPRRPFVPRANSWAEERLLDSERQSADYTVRFFLVMLSHGVEKIFLHSGVSGRVNDPNLECALFDSGCTPRKLFAAQATVTELLGESPVYAAKRRIGNYGHAVAFETGKRALVALWNEYDDTTCPQVIIPRGQNRLVLDVVGRTIADHSLVLCGSPTYLVGPPGQAKELLESLKTSSKTLQADSAEDSRQIKGDAGMRHQMPTSLLIVAATGIVMPTGAQETAPVKPHAVANPLVSIIPGHARHKECVSPESAAKAMRQQWFRDAKFGMFVHWGPFAVHGSDPHAKFDYFDIKSNLALNAEFEQYTRQFHGRSFDAAKWMETAKVAGAKYVVLTAKHHDGYALFDSKVTTYDSVDMMPKTDFARAFSDAARAAGLKVGFYYSMLDWHEPTYRTNLPQFVDEFLFPQVRELCTQYGPLDCVWFDGEWDHPAATWKAPELVRMIRQLQPMALVNDRLGLGERGVTPLCDFYTREQPSEINVPMGFEREQPVPWEACMTIGGFWQYSIRDTQLKSSAELIRILVDVVSRGGNLLLNVGPTPDGRIPQPLVERLQSIGVWLAANGESVYGTQGSPFKSLPAGKCTTKGNRLYIHLETRPDGPLQLPGLQNLIQNARFLNGRGELAFDNKTKTIVLPETLPDVAVTTVVVQLDGLPVVCE